MARILPTDRLLLVGKTRSGKSTVAAYLFSLFRVQRVLIDPKGEWQVRGAVVVRSPAQLEQALDRAPLIRYVPARADRDEWEQVYAVLFERRRLFVWTDEAASVSEAGWQPRGLRLLQMQGAGLGLGHMACTQRPVKIAPELRSEAEHVMVFAPPLARPDDLASVADELGLGRDQLRAELAELPPHGFLWFERRTGETTVCPPLPEHLRRASGARGRAM